MRAGKRSCTFISVTDAKLYSRVYTDDLFLSQNLAQFCFCGVFI